MKSINDFLKIITVVFVVLQITYSANINDDFKSFVVSSSNEITDNKTVVVEQNNKVPRIYSMNVHTNISNRYATTVITSKVLNSKSSAAEATFSVILPENAFISEFIMEIGNESYKAYVKEKQEAKKIYDEAVSSGQTAAHVEVNARNSRAFTVSVNIEPESKTVFHLKYEELLQRMNERYELVLNIRPGQVVEELKVQVRINETSNLKFVEVPALRSGNEIGKNDEYPEANAEMTFLSRNSALITFNPSLLKQQEFAQSLGTEKVNGLAGQLVVQYDVDRDTSGGEILVRDGYFVHFFSPEGLEPLPKHIVFVLDHSGSMSGGKIRQLGEAMTKILSQLRTEDVFNVIRFTESAYVWDIERNNSFVLIDNLPKDRYGKLEPILKEKNLPNAIAGNADNLRKAKEAIRDSKNLGWTNIVEGLEVALFLTKRVQSEESKRYQPMILFLTDGDPNFGMQSTDEITKVITELNDGDKRASIFSLSFGKDADKQFLQKLSLGNLGFSRHIYEAADASLQLQEFYKLISSPLLYNVTFKYLDENEDDAQITRTHHPILFKGSEIVIAGRMPTPPHDISIDSFSKKGPVEFRPEIRESHSSLERLWAYLSVKQFLENGETAENKTELTEKALNIAMKYSFVTPLTSLVVVKPNNTRSVDGVDPDGPRDASRGRKIKKKTIRRLGFRRQSANFARSQPFARYLNIAPRTAFLRVETNVKKPKQPKWLKNLSNRYNGLIIVNGTDVFKLGKIGDVVERPNCGKTPGNGTEGECTIIFECPTIFPLLTDLGVFLEYFCPLGRFAGVCCPILGPKVLN